MRRLAHIPFIALVPLLACTPMVVAPPAPEAPPPTPATPPIPPPGPTKPAYPAATKVPVTDSYRDTKVTDDYRWLEDWNDPAVKAWSEAQNGFARAWLDASPAREAVRARVASLLGDSTPWWSGFVAQHGVYFALEHRPPKQQPYLVVLASLDDPKSARVLVDPTTLDPSGGTSIGWFVPSPDGKRVAVSLAKGGAENGNVRVFDVATGKATADDVPQADGSGSGDCLAWKSDGRGFYYTRGRPDGDASNAFRHINFHRLGDAPDKDATVLGKDGRRIDQWEVVTGGDDRTVVARVEDADSGNWEHWVLPPGGQWVRVATREAQVKRVVVGPDGALYLVSARGAPKHTVLGASAKDPSIDKAKVLLPEGDTVLVDVLPTRSRVYLLEDAGGVSRIRIAPLAHGKLGAPTPIAAPGFAMLTDLVPLGGDDVAFTSMSYTEPRAVYRVQAKTGSVQKTGLAAVSVADFSGVDVTREACTSRDGTKVPITILRAKAGAGPTQALLTGYGGFGDSLRPRFRAHTLTWIEQGGLYAVANLRGGSELGEDWHTGGNLTHKQNVFDDFYACAQHLVLAGYTTPDKLAIQEDPTVVSSWGQRSRSTRRRTRRSWRWSGSSTCSGSSATPTAPST